MDKMGKNFIYFYTRSKLNLKWKNFWLIFLLMILKIETEIYKFIYY